MALIFLGVPTILTFSVSSFIKSNWPNFIANNEWSLEFIRPQSTGIRLGGNAEVLLQAAAEAKTVPKFTDAL